LDTSGTNSKDDTEGEDTHKLAQIRHALVTLKQPVTAILKGQYEYDSTWEEVVFQTELRNVEIPEDILALLQATHGKIEVLARFL
jgi:uncharacterized protein YhaN